MRQALCKGGTKIRRNCRQCREIAITRGLVQPKVPVVHVTTEFLPPGEGEYHPPTGESNGRLSSSPTLDNGRFRFLEGQASLARIIRLPEALGNGKYSAFVLQLEGGAEVALLDCDFTSNALYVFDASQPAWLEKATMTKPEVLRHGKPELLRRIYHSDGWQERVTDLLRTL